MSVIELALGYLGVGVVLAIAFAVRRAGTTIVDAVLVVGLWPVFAPILASSRAAPDVDPAERALLDRLQAAVARRAELDASLTRPDLDEAAARSRVAALEQGGASPRAIAAAAHRVEAIRALQALRAETTAEIEELREALAQHRAQAELARFGGNDPAAPGVGDP